MLKELLSTCGLNQTDQDVFLFLVKHGARSAGLISKATALNRSTVYSSLANLVQQGFVNKTKHSSTTSFAAVPPKLLGKVIENSARHKFSEVILASSRIPAELEAIARPTAGDAGGVEVIVFESAEAVYAHLDESLARGDFCSIFNPETAFAGAGKLVHTKFLRRTAITKPRIRELIVAGPTATWYRRNIRNPNHQVKEIAPSVPFISDMIFSNGSVIISNYEKSGEFALRITNRALFHSMQSVFELLWGVIGSPKKG